MLFVLLSCAQLKVLNVKMELSKFDDNAAVIVNKKEILEAHVFLVQLLVNYER
jgi:hypothetical protein